MNVGKKFHGKTIYYFMLIIVVITWGLDPIINSYFYNFYSASALVSVATFASAIMFFILSFKKLKQLNKNYLKVAVPISLLNSIVCLLQRIGLQYTTPANYAFLEQLSCVVVPIMMFVFIRKKPTLLQGITSIVCITGCFIFSGVTLGDGFNLGIGELLCTLAGILFGVSIAATAIYMKKLDITLFMMIHMFIYFLTSLSLAISLNFIKVGGVPLEKLVFTFDINLLVIMTVFGLFSVGLCWLLRTEATRNINPTVVAIISPFSAIITGIISVILLIDKPTKNFIVGSIIIILSMVISTVNDIITDKKERAKL